MNADLAQRYYWYNRMMNVSQRGFIGVVPAIPPSPPKFEWTASFSEDCPKDFIELFKQNNPSPRFIPNPTDPVHGTWGEVSVWHEFMKTGYICSLNYDVSDVKSLTFSYDIMKNGHTVHEDAFTVTLMKLKQLKPYLRELWLDGYDPKYEGLDIIVGNNLDKGLFGRNNSVAMCSSVRTKTAGVKDARSFQGRNFDFTYDDRQTYLIHVRNTPQNYAFNCMVKDMFKEGTYVRLLPNMAVDGINQNGVCVNVNVVSKKDLDDMGKQWANTNEGTKPGATRVHMLCMSSVILAQAESAVHALELMHQYCIYGDLAGKEHVHFMISDKDDTFRVEVIGNRLKTRGWSRNEHYDCEYVTEYEDKQPPIMTNWYLCNDSQPRFPSPYVRGKYTSNACGIERYDQLTATYTRGGYEQNEQWTADLMQSVKFSNQATKDPATDIYYPFSDFGWGAEWTQMDYLENKDGFRDRVDAEIANIKSILERKDRTKGIWITSHSVVYDIDNKTMRLVFEEEFDQPPIRSSLWLRE